MSGEKQPQDDNNLQVTQNDSDSKGETKPNEEQPQEGNPSKELEERLAELEKQNQALRATMSSKDKKHKTTQEQIDELSSKLEKQSLELELSRKLDENTDIPHEVKTRLRSTLSNFNSVDAFENTLSIATESFKYGKDTKLKEQSEKIDDNPKATEKATLTQKLQEAKNPGDLKEVFEKMKG